MTLDIKTWAERTDKLIDNDTEEDLFNWLDAHFSPENDKLLLLSNPGFTKEDIFD